MTSSVEPLLLPIVRAADLSDAEQGGRWLVEGLWARAGVGIIGGAPKTCKSWMGLDMALSVASGTPCLDVFPVQEPGGALIYLAEDAASVVKERLLGLCQHRGLHLSAQPIDVITAPSLRLDLALDQRRLAETVRTTKPRIVLLDPFVRLHRIDENHAGDVSSVLAYLRELQRTHDIAVVVVHHARKNGASGVSGAQSLRGSGDFYAWVDSALTLRRQRQQLALQIEHRAAASPDPIALRLVTGDQPPHLALIEEMADDEDVESAHRSTDAGVLNALSTAKEPMTRPALRAVLHVRNARLGEAIARLKAQGKILRHGEAWIPAPIPITAP